MSHLLAFSLLLALHLHFDSGWWARAHWTAAAFDYSSTGLFIHDNPYTYEKDPLARILSGRRPSDARLAAGWTAECAAVSFIPNRKLRRIIQIGAIGAHTWFGYRNLRNWH